MTPTLNNEAPARLVLEALTAEEIMTPNPVSIRANATIKEAIALLADKGYSAAPVIDEAGRPIGVLSRSDIVVHEREKIEYLQPIPEFFSRSDLVTPEGEKLPRGFQVEKVDQVCVRDLMTPVVFSVGLKTPVRKVVSEMVALRVHRLFVVDASGVLVGVISALDVLRHLD
jgi:CBS domain-containing protein